MEWVCEKVPSSLLHIAGRIQLLAAVAVRALGPFYQPGASLRFQGHLPSSWHCFLSIIKAVSAESGFSLVSHFLLHLSCLLPESTWLSQRRFSAFKCSYDQTVLPQGIQVDILVYRSIILITLTESFLYSQILGFGAWTFLAVVCVSTVRPTTWYQLEI